MCLKRMHLIRTMLETMLSILKKCMYFKHTETKFNEELKEQRCNSGKRLLIKPKEQREDNCH